MAAQPLSFYGYLLVLVCLTTLPASAMILSAPTATTASGPRFLEPQITFLPQPTHLNPVHELFARQQITRATCGYINGASSAPVTCNAGLYCATTSTFVGCCESANCRNIFTKCYDLLGETCDQACQNNPQNLLCSSTVPYCAEYLYEGGSTGLGCAQISGYTSSVLLTIASGLGSLTTTSAAATTTVTPTIPASEPVATSSHNGGGLSTGATAGIAVAATLVGVGLIGGLIWFLIKRRRKNSANNGTVSPKPELAQVNSTRLPTPRDNRVSGYSELAVKSPSPNTTPDTQQQQWRHSGQPSPAFNGPPQYSQHYDGQIVEMPGNDHPPSHVSTDLNSSR